MCKKTLHSPVGTVFGDMARASHGPTTRDPALTRCARLKKGHLTRHSEWVAQGQARELLHGLWHRRLPRLASHFTADTNTPPLTSAPWHTHQHTHNTWNPSNTGASHRHELVDIEVGNTHDNVSVAMLRAGSPNGSRRLALSCACKRVRLFDLLL